MTNTFNARREQMLRELASDLANLVENVANYLFDQKPECALVAPQLCLFWSDLPDEMSQAFYNMLGSAAESGRDSPTTGRRCASPSPRSAQPPGL